LDEVRVKEINYFDGMPILTMKSDLMSTGAIDYKGIVAGEFHQATIEKVNEVKKQVILRLNDFVKGVLPIH
jgi:hypothetical protein